MKSQRGSRSKSDAHWRKEKPWRQFRDGKVIFVRNPKAIPKGLVPVEGTPVMALLTERLGRHHARAAEALTECRDYRRYKKTLARLKRRGEAKSIYFGVLDVDLADLIKTLPGLLERDDRDRELIMGETFRFVQDIDTQTFKGRYRKRYLRPADVPTTIREVQEALNLRPFWSNELF